MDGWITFLIRPEQQHGLHNRLVTAIKNKEKNSTSRAASCRRRYLFPQQQVSLSRRWATARTCLPASQRDTSRTKNSQFRLSPSVGQTDCAYRGRIQKLSHCLVQVNLSQCAPRRASPEMLSEQIFVQIGPFDHFISEFTI
jgi:hypothetical protein